MRQFNDATRPAKQVTFFDAEVMISGWEGTTDLTADPLVRLINWSTFGGDTEDTSLSARSTVLPDVTSTTAIPTTNHKPAFQYMFFIKVAIAQMQIRILYLQARLSFMKDCCTWYKCTRMNIDKKFIFLPKYCFSSNIRHWKWKRISIVSILPKNVYRWYLWSQNILNNIAESQRTVEQSTTGNYKFNKFPFNLSGVQELQMKNKESSRILRESFPM